MNGIAEDIRVDMVLTSVSLRGCLLDTSRARRGGFERLEGRDDYNLKARAA